jgi:hypothetical protein
VGRPVHLRIPALIESRNAEGILRGLGHEACPLDLTY